MDDRLLRHISESDVIELNLSPHIAQGSALGGFVDHLLLVQELRHALAGRQRRLNLRKALADLAQRRCEQADVDHKRHYHGKLDAARKCHGSAHDAHRHIPEVPDEAHQRMHESCQKLSLEGVLSKPLVALPECFKAVRLCVVGADNGLAGIILFHMAVDLRKALLPCVEVLLGSSHDETHADEPNQRSADGGQSHVPFSDEHHYHASHQCRRCGYQRSDAHVQRLRDHVDVVGDAGQCVAIVVRIKVVQRHAIDLGGYIRAHALADMGGDVIHDERLEIIQHHAAPIDGNQNAADPGDFTHVYMYAQY